MAHIEVDFKVLWGNGFRESCRPIRKIQGKVFWFIV